MKTKPARGLIHSRSTQFNQVSIRKVHDRIEMEVAGGSFGTWHPRCLLTAYYWDALGAGCLLHPKSPTAILVLGLGGGTIVNIIRHLLPKAKITAVEIDSELVDLATRYLHLEKSSNLEIVIGDAYDYLATTRKRFDIVIDDLFLTGTTDVYRPVIDSDRMMNLLTRCSRSEGIVMSNLVTHQDHRNTQIQIRKAYGKTFRQIKILRPQEGANEIIVGGKFLRSWRATKSVVTDFQSQSDHRWWKSITVKSK